MKKNSFKFTESKKTEGMIKHLEFLADEEDRSLNNYVGRILWKHLEEVKTEDDKSSHKES